MSCQNNSIKNVVGIALKLYNECVVLSVCEQRTWHQCHLHRNHLSSSHSSIFQFSAEPVRLSTHHCRYGHLLTSIFQCVTNGSSIPIVCRNNKQADEYDNWVSLDCVSSLRERLVIRQTPSLSCRLPLAAETTVPCCWCSNLVAH